MELFRLIEPKAVCGDYANILQHGMVDRAAGTLEVTRAGPFVPPISFPYGAIIVTLTFKAALEQSGLSGISFRPVLKKRIVKIDWEKWDGKPKFFPRNGEPEDYLMRKHSPSTASKMEELFELIPEQGAKLRKIAEDPKYRMPAEKLFAIETPTYSGKDLFRPIAENFWPIWLASDRAKAWFERNAEKWVRFVPMSMIGRLPSGNQVRRTSKIAIQGMPAPFLNLSCGEDYVGAHAFSADGKHLGVQFGKGPLQLWNLAERRLAKEFTFEPLPNQKKPPDLSGFIGHSLALNSNEVWGTGTSQGVRYLLNGSWIAGLSREPLLLSKGISIAEYDGEKQLSDRGVFSSSANGFLWFSGHDLSYFDLAQWPARKKVLLLKEQVANMSLSRTGSYGAIISNNKRLYLINIGSNSLVAEHELVGNCQQIAFVGDDFLLSANLKRIAAIKTKDGSMSWKIRIRPISEMTSIAPLVNGEWLLARVEEKKRRDLLWVIRSSSGQIAEFCMNPEDLTETNFVEALLRTPEGNWVGAHLSRNVLIWRSENWIRLVRDSNTE